MRQKIIFKIAGHKYRCFAYFSKMTIVIGETKVVNYKFFTKIKKFFVRFIYDTIIWHFFMAKWLWSIPFEDTTLKKMRQVHYLLGGAEMCTYYDFVSYLQDGSTYGKWFVKNFINHNFCLINFYDLTRYIRETNIHNSWPWMKFFALSVNYLQYYFQQM